MQPLMMPDPTADRARAAPTSPTLLCKIQLAAHTAPGGLPSQGLCLRCSYQALPGKAEVQAGGMAGWSRAGAPRQRTSRHCCRLKEDWRRSSSRCCAARALSACGGRSRLLTSYCAALSGAHSTAAQPPQLLACLQIQPTVACFAGDSTSARLGRGSCHGDVQRR